MKYILALFCLTLFSNSYAAVINYGGYFEDTDSNLNWLDLTATTGVSYNDALSVGQSYEGGGWRYATNPEIENLFSVLFTDYFSNVSDDASDNRVAGAYSDHIADTNNFFNLFGATNTGNHYISYGLYEDEDGLIRNMGAWQFLSSNFGAIYGLEFSPTYDPNTVYANYTGTYLVRGTSVSEPATAFLLGLGLIGMLYSRKIGKAANK